MAIALAKHSGDRYKLAELSEATGVSKKTIHYYVHMGLLPPAEKIHGRLSLYDNNHLKLLQLILRLKEEKQLPLAFIRELFEQGGFDADSLELNEIPRLLEDQHGYSDLLQEKKGTTHITTSLPEDLQYELFDRGLISKSSGDLGKEELKLALLLKSASDKGVPLEHFESLSPIIDEMVEIERQILFNSIDSDSDSSSVVGQMFELDELVNKYITSSKNHRLRKHFEQSYADGPLTIQKLREQIYVPSDAFLEKHGLFEHMAKLETAANKAGNNHKKRLEYAESLLAIGKYEEAELYASKILDSEADNLPAKIIKLSAEVLQNKPDQAIVYAEEIGREFPEDARITSFHAIACLVQASIIGGIISPAQWLRKSMSLFQKSLSLEPGSAREELEILLMKGRAYSILPENFNKVEEGIEALNRIHELLKTLEPEDIGHSHPAFFNIIEANVNFYLGEAWQVMKNEDAMREAWQKVLLSDPHSNFGQYIYQRLK